ISALKAGDFVDSAKMSVYGKGLAGAGLVFAAFGVKDAADRGDYVALTKNVGEAGRLGTDLLVSTLGSMNTAAKVAGSEGLRSAKFLDRLSPGIGVVTNALALGIDAKNFADDPSF